MAFCELKYRSKALEKSMAANILIPEGDLKPPYPVLYLLHGLSDDHTQWTRFTSLERYLEKLPLIVVMPDTGRGFYTDAKEGPAWETALVRDLIGYVDTILPTKATRDGRCLAGLSMGGYGALKLALKYPDLFCAGVSHSGALNFASRDFTSDESSWVREFRRIFGAEPAGGPDDIFALAEQVPVEKRPALRFDCGVDDFLIEENRACHAHLTEIGYPHEYEEFTGNHNWAYWDTHIQEALAFLCGQLGIARQTT